MISSEEKKIIIDCAKKYNASYVILFGSSIADKHYNDIDIAVKGVDPKMFFKFYGELFKYLPKPVDLIDLSHKSSFNEYVELTGMKIYG